MEKIITFIQENQITAYLIIVFTISLIAFFFMWINPKWQTPENPSALPMWVIAVWSPTVSAFIIWGIQGRLLEKAKSIFTLPVLSPWILILLVPIIIMVFVMVFHPTNNETSGISPSTLLLLFILNLMLGPLGEEAGWRGLLLPIMQSKYGWMGASLIIGLIWSFWHAPLWSINSPQSEINFFIFTGHVFAYSILMTILYIEAKGSIITVIIFHLLVNVTSGYITIIGFHSTSLYYQISLYYYIGFSVIIAGIYELFRTKVYDL